MSTLPSFQPEDDTPPTPVISNKTEFVQQPSANASSSDQMQLKMLQIQLITSTKISQTLPTIQTPLII